MTVHNILLLEYTISGVLALGYLHFCWSTMFLEYFLMTVHNVFLLEYIISELLFLEYVFLLEYTISGALFLEYFFYDCSHRIVITIHSVVFC